MSRDPRRVPPAGYRRLRRGGTEAWVLPEAEAWVRGALEAGETLARRAEREALEHRSGGRGRVHLVPDGSGGSWAIRHYWRGGSVASFLGDRYLRAGEPRPFRELRASKAVRALGFETPRVVAGAVYRSGPVYRADLATRFLDGAVEVRDLLFPTAPPPGAAPLSPEARIDLLERAGRLIAGLARTGILHRDLNAGNLLARSGDPGPRPGGPLPLPGDRGERSPKPHRRRPDTPGPPSEDASTDAPNTGLVLLDLDRCRVGPGPDPRAAERMLARFVRSLRKEAGRRAREIAPSELAAVRRGAGKLEVG